MGRATARNASRVGPSGRRWRCLTIPEWPSRHKRHPAEVAWFLLRLAARPRMSGPVPACPPLGRYVARPVPEIAAAGGDLRPTAPWLYPARGLFQVVDSVS